MSDKIPAPQVVESVEYDNLIAEVIGYEEGFQPKKPEVGSDFPFELKVHIWRAGEAQLFARTIGKRLSSDRKKFFYSDGVQVNPENAVYFEKRPDPFKKGEKGKNYLKRIERQHWTNTIEFSQNGFAPYVTFTLVFRTVEQLAKFSKRVKQLIALTTKSIDFPKKRKRVWKYNWVSQWNDCNPKCAGIL